MKKLFIVANWKANKTEEEALIWLQELKKRLEPQETKEIIICPPFHLFSTMKKNIREYDLPFELGSQDVSKFGRGAYTGEMPASLISVYAKYSLVGHSERRTNFKESDKVIAEKVSLILSSNMFPVVCVQDENTPVPGEVFMVAYEPVAAIGTGIPDTPENANLVAQKIKQKLSSIKYVLYGGSVTGENVAEFTTCDALDGVLVGGASLDPQKFVEVIKNA